MVESDMSRLQKLTSAAQPSVLATHRYLTDAAQKMLSISKPMSKTLVHIQGLCAQSGERDPELFSPPCRCTQL